MPCSTSSLCLFVIINFEHNDEKLDSFQPVWMREFPRRLTVCDLYLDWTRETRLMSNNNISKVSDFNIEIFFCIKVISACSLLRWYLRHWSWMVSGFSDSKSFDEVEKKIEQIWLGCNKLLNNFEKSTNTEIITILWERWSSAFSWEWIKLLIFFSYEYHSVFY